MPARQIANAAVVPCWTTFLGAMSGALAALDGPVPLFQLAGRTGFAFRMNVREDADASGPSTYPSAEVTRRAFDQAGRDFDHFMAAADDNIFGLRRQRALAAVEAAIDRGAPVVAWGLLLTEYGLITGYDRDSYAFSVSTVLGREADSAGVPYTELGLAPGNFLDVIIPREKADADPARVAVESLRLAVGHALGAEPHYAGFANGLAGYGLWIEALRAGRAELFGTGYSIQVYGEARRFAREYLADLVASDVIGEPAGLAEAADYYGRVADNFAQLAELIQFRPDVPREERVSADSAAEAVQLLERALFWEREGVSRLEQVLVSLGKRRQ